MSDNEIKGNVVSVRGPIIDVRFDANDRLPSVSEIIKTHNHEGDDIVMEVMEQKTNNTVRCVSLSMNMGLARNAEAIATGNFIMMPDPKNSFGRLMNAFGEPLDEQGPISMEKSKPIRGKKAYGYDEVNVGRKKEYRLITTGIKMLDLLFPLVVGSKTGILGGAACGKSVLTLEVIHNIVEKGKGACVFAGAGERIREGNELYLDMKESGILDRVALVFGQMNETPGIRYEVAYSGITLAEAIQEKGEDVLFFIDNVFRFAQAGAELSALMGRIPSETGYQPTLVSEVGEFHERIRSTAVSSITALEAVYVPADDLTDPAVVAIFSHLDSIIVLSRGHVQRGLYPAIDPVASSSAFIDPAILGERHVKLANGVRRTFQKYEELKKIVAVIGLEELSQEDRTVCERAMRLENFLTQPFFVAEKYTGAHGAFVELDETLEGCQRILAGEVDHVPVEKFYMKGMLDEKAW
ncbi:MAG: F0F1 ATP synthase subunit beta [Candidatus Omnitrophica bacterium]|nr:F0F1 ATP synthase subunit beta [Candidatus Omnitrophota bacterium]